jgi:hypothetical protein
MRAPKYVETDILCFKSKKIYERNRKGLFKTLIKIGVTILKRKHANKSFIRFILINQTFDLVKKYWKLNILKL